MNQFQGVLHGLQRIIQLMGHAESQLTGSHQPLGTNKLFLCGLEFAILSIAFGDFRFEHRHQFGCAGPQIIDTIGVADHFATAIHKPRDLTE